MSYENDLDIDLEMLEKEWLKQPGLYAKYSQLKAEAKKEMDRAAEKVKTVRSELILKAKKGDKELLGFKPTESTIEAWYRTQDAWQEAKQEYIDAEYEYNMMDGAVFAFSQRKSALESLVSLWIGNYYSTPKSPKSKDGESFKSKALDKSDEKQREALNRKRRKKS